MKKYLYLKDDTAIDLDSVNLITVKREFKYSEINYHFSINNEQYILKVSKLIRSSVSSKLVIKYAVNALEFIKQNTCDMITEHEFKTLFKNYFDIPEIKESIE